MTLGQVPDTITLQATPRWRKQIFEYPSESLELPEFMDWREYTVFSPPSRITIDDQSVFEIDSPSYPIGIIPCYSVSGHVIRGDSWKEHLESLEFPGDFRIDRGVIYPYSDFWKAMGNFNLDEYSGSEFGSFRLKICKNGRVKLVTQYNEALREMLGREPNLWIGFVYQIEGDDGVCGVLDMGNHNHSMPERVILTTLYGRGNKTQKFSFPIQTSKRVVLDHDQFY